MTGRIVDSALRGCHRGWRFAEAVGSIVPYWREVRVELRSESSTRGVMRQHALFREEIFDGQSLVIYLEEYEQVRSHSTAGERSGQTFLQATVE